MTLCIKTGHHCNCQPDEGVWCPDYKVDSYVQYLMGAIEEKRRIIGLCHEAIGEAAGSDDETLPESIATHIRERSQRISELESARPEGTFREGVEAVESLLAGMNQLCRKDGACEMCRDFYKRIEALKAKRPPQNGRGK